MNIQPANEVRANMINNKHQECIDYACNGVVEAITRASQEGRTYTVFNPPNKDYVMDNDILEAEVKKIFHSKGYTFRPLGIQGGVRQIGDYICW